LSIKIYFSEGVVNLFAQTPKRQSKEWVWRYVCPSVRLHPEVKSG